MKQILIFLLAFIPCFVFAQYPTKQKLGNDSSLVFAPGAISTTGGLITGRYTDTTAANCDMVVRYSVLTHVTLSASDPTYSRFDGIFLDSTGVIVVTGTPSANPAQPQPTDCQIVLTYVLVEAGATTPSGIVTTIIYDENTGSPTEWPGAATSVMPLIFKYLGSRGGW